MALHERTLKGNTRIQKAACAVRESKTFPGAGTTSYVTTLLGQAIRSQASSKTPLWYPRHDRGACVVDPKHSARRMSRGRVRYSDSVSTHSER